MTARVRPFLKCQSLGDAIVDDGLAIAVNADDLLAVHPTYRYLRLDAATGAIHADSAGPN
ncbi:MAG TPA: hypothetical protein VHW09_27635 [Bryobacteraceae bacterium]|jgi:hypothetical protein|nr:hypothetical protein [Bryobacteraceae bacterium]